MKPFIFKAETLQQGGTVKATMSAYDWKNAWGGETSGALTEHSAYQEVSWVRRCVELRANALSSIPVKVYKGDTETEWEFANDMPLLLWLTEAALQIYGAAYWGRKRNVFGIDRGYRWLLPPTMKPVITASEGLTGFERRLSGEPIPVALEDVVYFWSPSMAKEVGPGDGWVRTILTEAGIVYNMDDYASGFFERGAISATILTVDGAPMRAEMDRLEAWWKRVLSGVKQAWETVAVSAAVKPQVIGYNTRDLAMPELAKLVREQIATAAGVPQTMLEDAANYATAGEHHQAFYSETVVPEARIIEAALNKQVFEPQGLKVVLDWQSLDIFQEDEAERSEALARMTQAGIPLDLAMEMLGMDLPGQMTYDDLRARLEEERAERTPPQLEAGDDAERPPTRAVSEDLDRWRRKSLSSLKAGNVADVPFVSDVIPDATAAVLHERLAYAMTAKEVRKIFASPFEEAVKMDRVEPEGEPLEPETAVRITAEDVDAAIARWNRVMPSEYADMLEAEVEE